MTDEDRIAYEEQQMLLEEETRKKKEIILSQFLKDKLAHEEAATRYNMCKLNILWREIMKTAKAKELKQDMEMLGQTFERVIDAKDAVMRALSKEIFEAEEMYAMAFRNHLQTVDKILGLQKMYLDTMFRNYYLELEMICREFDIERAIIIEQHYIQINNIDDIMFAMELNNADEEREARLSFESMEVELKNKSIEGKQALRGRLETKIEELWQQFRQTLQSYSDTNEDRKTKFEVLKLKDDKRSKEVETNMRKMRRLEEQISSLQFKLSETSSVQVDSYKDDQEDEEFNRAERVRLMRHFHQVKYAMNLVRMRSRDKLIAMTTESTETIKELKKVRDKGVFLLKLTEVCRKLETEEEKVIPFYKSSLTVEEEEEIKRMDTVPQLFQLVEVVPEASGLENFWKRYNKVLLDKLSIDKELQSLTEENLKLRTILKQYLDDISVNDDVMLQDNPLLVINSKNGMKKVLF